MPDQTGAQIWRPARLEDVLELPFRVWQLYLQFRAGQAQRAQPELAWWRDRPPQIAHLAHLYRRSRGDVPDGKALCGYDPATKPDPQYRRDDLPPRCNLCERAAAGKAASSGTIGGVDVSRPLGGD